MTDPTLVAIAAFTLGAGLSMYAVFAGADFGGGVWDLLAFGERKAEQRSAISRAKGAPREQRFFGIVFSVSSLVTPFALGAAAGVVAAGDLKPAGDGWEMVPWDVVLKPFPIATGLLAVCICAYTAATFLTAQTEGALQADFRRRALVAGAGFTLCSVLGLVLAQDEAPELAHELLHGRALPLVVVAGVLAILGFVVAWTGAARLARYVAVAFVLAVLWGWALAQWPYLITPYLTFQDAASSDAMLEVYLVCLAVGAAFLVPSLIYLWRTFGGKLPEA